MSALERLLSTILAARTDLSREDCEALARELVGALRSALPASAWGPPIARPLRLVVDNAARSRA